MMAIVESWLTWIFSSLINSSIQISVLILLILIIRLTFRRFLQPRICFALWLVLIARMMLPWMPESRLSLYNWVPGVRSHSQLIEQDLSSRKIEPSKNFENPPAPVSPIVSNPVLPGMANHPANPLIEAHHSTNIPSESIQSPPPFKKKIAVPLLQSLLIRFLSWIWMIGVIAFSGQLYLQSYKLRKSLHQHGNTPGSEVLNLLEQCKREMNLNTHLSIIESPRIKSPALYGVFRPKLLLPAGAMNVLGSQRLRFVFLHELAHLKRQDVAIGWLMTLLQILYWLNPLVWYAFFQMRSDRELAADALALHHARSGESDEYGKTIIQMLEHFSRHPRFSPMTGILENYSQLKTRLSRIAHFRKNTHSWSVLGILLVLLLGLSVLTNAKTIQDPASQESNEDNNKAFIQVTEMVEAKMNNERAESIWPTDIPNLFLWEPAGAHLFNELIVLTQNLHTNKTGRNHTPETYDEIFNGTHRRKPDDLLILAFALDSNERIPSKYEDLLPEPWPDIEVRLLQGEKVELLGHARDLNVILLAVPKRSQLKECLEQSRGLADFVDRYTSPHKKKGPREIPLEEVKDRGVSYTLSIPKNNWRVARVRMNIQQGNPLVLNMNNNGAPLVPDGNAAFVKNLTAIDALGNPVELKKSNETKWILASTSNPPVTVEYLVTLKHDTQKLPWGPDEAPYLTPEGVFWTGRSLFLYPKTNQITIEFQVPSSWKVSTPWQPVPGELQRFLVPHEKDLINSFILAGTHQETLIKANKTEILLAIGDQIKGSASLIETRVQNAVNAFSRLFGNSPQDRVLIVVNPGLSQGRFDGGVFGRSISLLMGDQPTPDNQISWAPFVFHELFHLWNGRAIQYREQEYWFSEGFTEYYTQVYSSRLGLYDEEAFLRKIENASEIYLMNSGEVSIRDAGNHKSKNSDLVYQGGLLIAFCLDLQIREASNSEKSLDDVMKAMYSRYGTTGDQYALNDVRRIVEEISGLDLTDFFAKYIEGKEILPLEEYFKSAGLHFQLIESEEKPDLEYVIHHLLRISSLTCDPSGLIVRRSENAGYQDEDILTQVNGNPVSSFEDLQVLAKDLNPGQTIPIILLRKNKEVSLDLVLGGEGRTKTISRMVNAELIKDLSIMDNAALFSKILEE